MWDGTQADGRFPGLRNSASQVKVVVFNNSALGFAVDRAEVFGLS